MERRKGGIRKLVQYKLYSLLASRWGMALLLIGFFVSFNSVMGLLNVIVSRVVIDPVPLTSTSEISRTLQTRQTDARIELTTSSTSSTSSSEIEATPTSEPPPNIIGAAPVYPKIDIVFTWVNGSDPRQIAALNEYKRIYQKELFETPDNTTGNTTKPYDDNSASRYVDNQEMIYSLRSIEQNMRDWVGHIYIVTNGQIPAWLNLSNPQISIVTHEEIYVNKSHLPVFSSPSIEVHLHRIPGLSEHFIYFNDDTMIGSPVWPDDWYTHSRGQKVYLSWPVPNCNDGCASGWIGDGYCDVACNTSSCNWDGGDCANHTGNAVPGNHNNNNNWWGGNVGGASSLSEKEKKYCAPGCPDSWIGDKYCDRTCRVKDCGYDAGDCDVSEMYQNLYGIDIIPGTPIYDLPDEITAAYFNLSGVVGTNKIVDGIHDASTIIRTATISQKYKIMTMTFFRNVSKENVGVQISYESGADRIDVHFNITIATQHTLVASLGNTTQVDENDAETELTLPTDQIQVETSTSESTSTSSSLQLENRPQETTSESAQIELPHPLEEFKLKRGDSNNFNLKSEEEVETMLDRRQLEEEKQIRGTSRKLLSLVKELQLGIPQLSTFNLKTKMNLAEDQGDEPMENFMDKDYFLKALTKVYPMVNVQLENSAKYQVEREVEILRNKMKDEYFSPPEFRHGEQQHDHEDLIYPWEIDVPKIDDSQAPFNLKFSTGRKLKDHYGDSLKFVNNLMNQAFGSSPRKVPAHMPHYLQKSIIQEMQDKWPEQFEETSGHRLRDPKDMQFAFAYFYFMIHQRVEFNYTHVWYKYLDSDLNGYLDDNEVRTLAVHLGPLPLHVNSVENLKAKLLNITIEKIEATTLSSSDSTSTTLSTSTSEFSISTSTPEFSTSTSEILTSTSEETSSSEAESTSTSTTFSTSTSTPVQVEGTESDFVLIPDVPIQFPGNKRQPKTLSHGKAQVEPDDLPGSVVPETRTIRAGKQITADLVQSNFEIYNGIIKHFSKKTKNRHETTDTEEVAFLMVGSNATNVEKSLDGIRERRQKFICLNDNMNHSDPHIGQVQKVLRDFYQSLYPLPSSFELPPSKYNKYLHIDELREAEEKERWADEVEAARKEAERLEKIRLELEERERRLEQKMKVSHVSDVTSPTVSVSQWESTPFLGMVWVIIVVVAVSILCIAYKIFATGLGRSGKRQTREERFMKLMNP
eukprot:TRINITY_DN3457_c0_g1_i1.p1 TRINITY_DN3457_c0_g1~~TRINITY_DN3457_c0_g1_i1.p1  ORF type:complete len:1204 (-),score=445.63 TRINITY_DN3457_c0_g1_i1:46-3657(-)